MRCQTGATTHTNLRIGCHGQTCLPVFNPIRPRVSCADPRHPRPRLWRGTRLLTAGFVGLIAHTGRAADPGLNTFSPGVGQALPSVVKLYGAAVGSAEGFSSGVLVSADGKVVTILSVMLDAVNLHGVTADGTTYPARVVRRDEARQLALLQLDLHAVHGSAAPNLPPLSPAETDTTQPGDWVLAVANPFKVAQGDEAVSVMLGVLSARTRLDARRYAQDYPYDGPVLVVDVITSNPGMAGGALLTLDGAWIGLIGRIAQSNLTGTRLNYALPAAIVREFLDAPADAPATLASRPASVAPARPGYHGIKLFELGFRRNLVFIDRVQRGSPAAEAGLKKDDLIVSVDGQTVPRGRVFRKLMSTRAAGETVTIVAKRGPRLITVKFTLGEPK